ncbi:MAG: hypothetical protein ACO1TE_18825 [Prosthecobacter sp.]
MTSFLHSPLLLSIATALAVPVLFAADAGDKKNAPIVNKTRAPLMPVIQGSWWTVAKEPQLGEFYSPKYEPVDFAIWQAADGTWQIWSCIRSCKLPKGTRLFHRWEGRSLTDTNWKAMGVVMQADESLGETPGGLQAPYVFQHDGRYIMFYGDWANICKAESKDGKTFERVIQPGGKTAMFTNGPSEINTRDPMVLKIGGQWHCYYTAHPGNEGVDYCRTSPDLKTWSESHTVSSGGRAAGSLASAECPFVIAPQPGHFYLLRTFNYFARPKTLVYYSADPLNFGQDQDDQFLLAQLPVAAPEVFQHEGQYFVAALLPELKGIRIAKLGWEPIKRPSAAR